MSVLSTARFVDAFSQAHALHTDAFPTEEHAVASVAAVGGAEQAREAPRDTAERIRLTTTDFQDSQLLLSRITDSSDAMTGLVHLRSRAAIEPLHDLLHHRSSSVAVRAAVALWRIAEDEQALSLLIRTVEHRPVWGRGPGRADAAAALTHIDRPGALAVLIDAIDDRDPIVQANARMAVAERLRLNAEWDALRSGYMSVPEFRAIARTALARGEDR